MNTEDIEKIINNYNRKKREKAINITAASLRLVRSEVDFFQHQSEIQALTEKFEKSGEKKAFENMLNKVEENKGDLEHILRHKYVEIVLKDSFHEYPVTEYQSQT